MTLSPDEIEKVARAIFDAENGLDGDCVGDMIHQNDRVDVRDGDKGLGDTMVVCRAAAQAALSALFSLVVERCAEAIAAIPSDDRGDDIILNKAEAAVRSLSPSAGSAWRPIEEAPRDGTGIILAKIIPADEEREAGIWWACAGRWQAEAPLSGTGGKIRRQAQWTDGIDNLGDPTHFMPLPSPPSPSEGRQTPSITEPEA